MNEFVAAASRKPDPLDKVAITATLDGFLATFRVTQLFRNVEADPIEAVFTFPVPYGATLVGVEAELAGKSLTSAALPKRAAENAYEDAVSSGDSAILVEEVSPGLYCVNLGNLAPGETATIAFAFAQLLEWRGDGLTLRIPTTIAPRYGRPAMREHAAPVAALDVVRWADLTLTLRAAGAKWGVSSPTHGLEVVVAGEDIVVRPPNGKVLMDRDIVVELRGAFQPAALSARDGDAHVVVASFQAKPDRKLGARARALKILVDRSGSMAGDSIAQARQALDAILNSLGPEDQFSLTGFGSSVARMTDGVVSAEPAVVAAALARARAMQADLGGTEMQAALLETFAQPAPRGDAAGADVLLITDGQSWDDRGIVAAARSARHRVFSIGVGSASATHLLRRLAEETGGACEIVTPREGMAERIVRQFARMDASRLTGRVEWPAGAVAVWPQDLGAIFAGDAIHAAAWFDAAPAGKAALALDPGDGDAERQFADIVPAASPPMERILAQVAAAGRVAETADEQAATALAVRYGLLTPHTHLVLIAERAEKLAGLPELRRASAMLAAGWMGNGGVLARRAPEAHAAMDVAPCVAPSSASAAPPPAPRGSARPTARRSWLGSLLGRASDAGKEPRRPPSDGFLRLRGALDGFDPERLDLTWLARAGAPSRLCEQLKAFLAPDVGERELALALLIALVSEIADDRLPRSVARTIRRAWADLRGLSPARRAELQEAVRAVASLDPWWARALAR